MKRPGLPIALIGLLIVVVLLPFSMPANRSGTAYAQLDMTPTPEDTPIATSDTVALDAATDPAVAVVQTQGLNIRSGPGMGYDVIAHLVQGDEVRVVGSSDLREWLLVEYGENWQGWAATELMTLNAPVESLPVAEPEPLPAWVRLEGFTHVQQHFNNCASAALTMALTYFGGSDNQDIVAAYLRPSPNDVSVDIAEMADYVNEQFAGVSAVWRMGGNWQLIRRLVAAGFPVVIETSVQVRGEAIPWAGHNRLVIGYDGDVILTYDSYLGSGRGQGYRVPQAELDEAWRHMNRDYLVLYPGERGPEVAAILGPHWRVDQSVALAQRVALAELASNPNDVYAQYNLGTTYAAMGRYPEAAAAFDEALRIGGLPVRFFWYRFSLFETYYYTGRYNELVWFAETTLKNMGSPRGTEELYYWLGLGYASTGRQGEAIAQLAQAIAVNPRFRPAIEALLQVQDGTYHAPV